MKLLAFPVAMLLGFSATHAQTWSLDKSHSRVGFTITHMMLTDVDGSFKTFDANLTASKPDLSDAVFEMTADASSINTDNTMRDGHLKGENFFNAAQYPAVSFKSTSFQKVDGKKYKMAGNLTMHGVTKPVTLDVTMNGPVAMESPRGKQTKVGFRAVGQLNRNDFGVGPTGAMSPVSDEVELKINGEFGKPEGTVAEKK